MTDQEFSVKIEELKEGYDIWQNVMKRYELSDKDYVIAFPHKAAPVNKCGIAHLRQFIEYGGAKKRVLLLYTGDKLPEMLSVKPDDKFVRIERLKEHEMEALVTLYSVSTISSHFIMMSLTRPDGRYGDKALEKGITLDEAVTLGIYGMTEKEIFERHDSEKER